MDLAGVTGNDLQDPSRREAAKRADGTEAADGQVVRVLWPERARERSPDEYGEPPKLRTSRHDRLRKAERLAGALPPHQPVTASD